MKKARTEKRRIHVRFADRHEFNPSICLSCCNEE